MNYGWITLNREISKHWVYKDAEYFKAWIAIIIEVNHSDEKVLIGRTLFNCNRGESLHSLENWGKLFGNWSKTKTKRFLDLLKNDSMIELKNERLSTRLSVCNYNKYQDVRNASETQVKRNWNASETQLKRERATNNNELTMETMINNEILPSQAKAKRSKFEYSEEFETFWSNWTKAGCGGSKNRSYGYWKLLTDEDISEIRNRAPKYIKSCRELNRSTKDLEGWINPSNRIWEAVLPIPTRTGDNRENVELLTTTKMYS
jgi:hypothetical protein